MKFKVGDKVSIVDENSYYINEVIENYIRHGNIRKNYDKYILRGAKVIGIVDRYYIVRFLDHKNNYVDLGYLEDNLEPFEDCEPNIITVSDFGDISASLSNDHDGLDMFGCEELRFDNFNLNYFVGKWGNEILILKTNDGILDYSNIINAFNIQRDKKVKIINQRKFYYMIKDMRRDLSEFQLNHRPLILKKLTH